MYSLDMVLEVIDIIQNHLISLAYRIATGHWLTSWLFA